MKIVKTLIIEGYFICVTFLETEVNLEQITLMTSRNGEVVLD